MAVRFDAENDTYTRSVGWGAQPAFSVSCWVYLSTDRNDYSTAWSLDNGTGNNIVVQTNRDGTTLGIVSNGNGPSVSLNMSVGQWYWVGVVKNGDTATVYFSTGTGTISSTNHSVTNSLTANTLRIGQSPWGGEWLNGRMAAVKIWTAALSENEIQAERDYTSPLRTADLRAWYPFEVAETTDHSGNGETLSGGSGATTEPGPGIPFSPVEDAEATAEIPLALLLNSGTQAEHAATAEIPLGLGLGAGALAEHKVSAEIPLSLSVAPETGAADIPDAEVWAEIPLGLGIGAGAVADHTVTTVIPLTLGVSPRADADEDVFNLSLVALSPVLGPQMVATTPRLSHGNATAPANVVRAALTPAMVNRSASHHTTHGNPGTNTVPAGKPSAPTTRNRPVGPVRITHGAPSTPAL